MQSLERQSETLATLEAEFEKQNAEFARLMQELEELAKHEVTVEIPQELLAAFTQATEVSPRTGELQLMAVRA